MLIDFPGVMTDFRKVKPGDFFVAFDEGDQPILAMKIFDNSAPAKAPAVLSFVTPVHPSMTPPMVLLADQFQNRDLLVLPEAKFRPASEISKLRRGLPSADRPGTVIVSGGGTFVRAYARNGTVDVNVATGAADSFHHQGAMWIDDWAIVLPAGGAERVLRTRYSSGDEAHDSIALSFQRRSGR